MQKAPVIKVMKQLPEPPGGQRDDEAVAHHAKFEEIQLTHLLSLAYATALSIRIPPPVPDQLLLGSLRDGRLRVKTPIVVKCTKENEDVIAEAVDFNEFGFGRNLSEALRDLQGAIRELYFTLEHEQNRLGPDLQHTWEKLQEKVVCR